MIKPLIRRALLVLSGGGVLLAAAVVPVQADGGSAQVPAAHPQSANAVAARAAVARTRAAAAAREQRAAGTGWRVLLRLPADQQSTLLGSITEVSPADAWSTGAAVPHKGRFHPLVERWNGTAWHPVTLPAAVAGKWQRVFPFSAIGASSGSDFWAFSEVRGGWLHWDGVRWSTGLLPDNTPNPLVISSTEVFSSTDVWVFGGHLTNTQNGTTLGGSYVAHFNGRRWTIVPGPAGLSAISAVSAVSRTSIWAVRGLLPLVSSEKAAAGIALVHWNGRRWRSVPLPAAFGPGASLTSIMTLSDNDVWVGGGIPNADDGLTATAAHWNGTAWSVTSPPAYLSAVKLQLVSLVPDGHGGIWGLGVNEGLTTSRLWHLRADGWTRPVVLRPCRRACTLVDLAQVPHTTSVWAAGAVLHGPSGVAVIALVGRVPQ